MTSLIKSIGPFVRRTCSRLRLDDVRSSRYFGTLDSSFDKGTATEKESKLQDLLDDSASGTGPLDEIDEEDEWRTSPYPVGAVVNPRQSQSMKSLRPRVDPSETSILLFPGQGSQYVGMGKELLKYPNACDIFEAANAILKYDLLKLMLNGPKSQLDQTKYCQPAVVVCSLAGLEKLKEERPSALESCIATAGFSVGEITALTFAGVFKFGDALKLVRTRAEAMQLASEIEPGGMATVIYSAESKLSQAIVKAKEWCQERGINQPECRIATYLHPNMKVIAGHTEALKFLSTHQNEFKLRKVIPVPVSGAFHTNLMLPAVDTFRKILHQVEMFEPSARIYSNVDGKVYKNNEHIKKQLPKQIYKPVLWEQVIQNIYGRSVGEQFPSSFICGPKAASLRTLLKNVNAKAARSCIQVFD